MNIFNLLTKKKHIVGIEISDTAIRFAYFNDKKGFNKKIQHNKKELVLIEEILEENIVSGGIVIDKKSLSKTLEKMLTKAKLKSSYAIVSIPEDKVYSHIFPFPKTENQAQLKEAINLAMNFELPIKKEDAYIGWENACDSNTINEILISTIPKNIADEYINALYSANIKILALESHLLSIARSAKFKFNETILFTKINPKESTIFIVKDRSIRFSRTISTTFFKENDFLKNEVSRVKTWFESEKKVSVSEQSLENATVKDEYMEYMKENGITPELQSKWLIALGTNIRGEIIEGEDKQISLLPIGTAEAYAYQKITIFITMLRNMTIGVSMFFLFTFFIVYLFILSLSQINNNTNSGISTSVYPDISQKEAFIKNVNSIISASKEIITSSPNWSILLDEINSRIINGISVSNLSVSSIGEKISLAGIAKDRNTLNQFKKTLQESTYFMTVELPITNIGQKIDIPFLISFSLKDPNMLYNK